MVGGKKTPGGPLRVRWAVQIQLGMRDGGSAGAVDLELRGCGWLGSYKIGVIGSRSRG
jgi:hypothetical protein